MAIPDLLWACPLCGLERGLRARDRATACVGCGATFRRGRGATILARRAGGREEARPAHEWLADLPPLCEANQPHTVGPERAVVRLAQAPVALRPGGSFVGWGESFGPRLTGRIALTPEALVFDADRGGSHTWALASLTAVQPTSSALQIKARDMPVAFVRFLEGSVRLWEHHIHHRLRTLFRSSGRGDIVEFQPRISTR